jgi:hypothetical protein
VTASWRDVAAGIRLIGGLPRYLWRRLDAERATALVAAQQADRERVFLRQVQGVLETPAHPYRALLRSAGCEYGDVASLTRREGLEAALGTLYRAGVYLTVEEFKGRCSVTRGSVTIVVEPDRLRRRHMAPVLTHPTSGSRGPRTPIPLDLAAIRHRGIHTGLPLLARGGDRWRTGVWGIPGGSLGTVLQYAVVGPRPARWFLQGDPRAHRLPVRYRWSAVAVRWTALACLAPLPSATAAPLDDPTPVARWMAGELRAGRVPHLDTFASPALGICDAAERAGLDLAGAQLTLAGEPMTAARRGTLQRAGLHAVPRYATVECGPVGYGCLAPDAPDDLHFFDSLHAVIQPGPGAPGPLPPHALLITTLQDTGPFAALNLSLGDQADLTARRCGCPLETIGWRHHMRTVRSFEKLTAGGMTFLDVDVVRVLEDVLPARFGGRPAHYQLVETEGQDGRPRMRLLVHPAVGAVDPAAVRAALLEALAGAGPSERVMALQWRLGGWLEVERRAPYVTGSGKVLHLHQEGPGAATRGRPGEVAPGDAAGLFSRRT